MHDETEKFLCMLAIAILITSITVHTLSAFAQTTKFSVKPQNIIDDTIEPGDFFTINMTVTDVEDLFGWQVKLSYDPSVLECIDGWLPPDHVLADKAIINPPPDIDNTVGSIFLLAMIITGAGVPGSGVNVTEGRCCQIKFEVKRRGHCNLSFMDLGVKTYLLNAEGEKVDFAPEEGYFDNRLPAPPATLYINPARIVDTAITPCQSFTVNITVAEVTDLYHWKLTVYYKNDILNVTDVSEGSFLQGGGATSFQTEIQNNYNTTHGRINANSTLLGATGVDGNGTLAIISFHVIDLGNSTITLSQTLLYDSTHETLSHSTSDGYFNNVLIAKLHVIPPEITDPTLLPGSNFEIEVVVEDVENMYGYEFNLTYGTKILTCIGVVIHSPLNETHFDAAFSAKDALGVIWVKVDYYPPANPITAYTNITLTTILFRVDSAGCTDLDLCNNRIIDPEGKPIPQDDPTGAFFCPLIREVAVVNVVPSINKAYESWTVYINVTVTNKGNITETFDVKAYYGENNIIGTITAENLDPDNKTTLTFTWNTKGVTPCHNYTIWAEAVAVPYETNTTDNIYENGKVHIKIMGDINGDGIVELQDFQKLSDAFGSSPGHPRWNPECDVNRDGIVELYDFLLTSAHFGEPC